MCGTQSWIRRAGVAVFVLASLCVGTVAPPHATGPDDFACAPVLVSHDESAHAIGPASSSSRSDEDHCVLCHSLRSFHPAFDKYEQRHDAPRAERLDAALVGVADRLDWALVPGRAPPA